MDSKLADYKRDFLKIEKENTNFIFKSFEKMRNSQEGELIKGVFHEIYESQFNTYIKMVKLRNTVLNCNEISEHEKNKADKTICDYILKYQGNLRIALDKSLG